MKISFTNLSIFINFSKEIYKFLLNLLFFVNYTKKSNKRKVSAHANTPVSTRHPLYKRGIQCGSPSPKGCQAKPGRVVLKLPCHLFCFTNSLAFAYSNSVTLSVLHGLLVLLQIISQCGINLNSSLI